jgi:hypothetical protein
MPLIVSTHPRTRKMIEAKGIEFNPLVKTMKPLGFNDYVKLQKYAKAVLVIVEQSVKNHQFLDLEHLILDKLMKDQKQWKKLQL